MRYDPERRRKWSKRMTDYHNDEIIEGEILEVIPGSDAPADVLEGEIVINRDRTSEDEVYDYVMGKGWWVLLLRGVILSAIGLAALLVPNATLNVLALLIGGYIVFDGLIHVVNGFRHSAGRGNSFVRGLLGIAIGAIVIAYSPQLVDVTSSAIVYVIAGFFLLAGLISILGSLRAGRVRWVSLIAGIAFAGIGALMFVNPDFFTSSFVRFLGFFILLGGVLVIVFAFKLRQVVKQTA
jgi:uncharacterized membrane protein HdeD (DUF308 family)